MLGLSHVGSLRCPLLDLGVLLELCMHMHLLLKERQGVGHKGAGTVLPRERQDAACVCAGMDSGARSGGG